MEGRAKTDCRPFRVRGISAATSTNSEASIGSCARLMCPAPATQWMVTMLHNLAERIAVSGVLVAIATICLIQYLYFVSRNDGTHHFSVEYREHVNAVNRYQKRRRR